MNAELFSALLAAFRIGRSDVFVPADRQMPVSEPNDAVIPQVGFVGKDYRPGGDILLGINPGGGGDAYIRTAEDSLLLPMIAALQGGNETSPDAVQTVFGQYAANMRTWNLWRIVEPVLQACQRSQAEVAYLNWCPFRTRSDAMPHAQVMRRCHEAYLAPLTGKLAPGRIIALGKNAGKWLEREHFGGVPRFVVPRTIGDSYLSTEALEVLETIKRSGR